MNQKSYEVITDRILEKMVQGVKPWAKQWTAGGLPQNAISGKAYRGINIFMLSMMPYTDHRWLTFKQAITLGGCVRKGEKSTPAIFWKFLDPKEQFDDKKAKSIPLLRHYSVFNVEQCDNLKIKPLSEIISGNAGLLPIEAAQVISDNMPKCPQVIHGGDMAAYSPSLDYIKMPNLNQFSSAEAYHATLFHEQTHATGHATRLGRVKEWTRFGTEPYALEELVAELGAAFLCSQCGIDSTLDQSAAYLDNWITVLKKDPRFIITAAAQAQKASDWILGVKFGEEKEDSE